MLGQELRDVFKCANNCDEQIEVDNELFLCNYNIGMIEILSISAPLLLITRMDYFVCQRI